MIQFKNEYVIVELVNDSTAILITWIGFVPSSIYREALEKALEIAQMHKIKRWVSDIKHMKVIGVQDQEWVTTDWLPKAVATGCYSKQAVILPEDLFGLATANNIITMVQSHEVEVRNFTQLEEAKTWLAKTQAPLY